MVGEHVDEGDHPGRELVADAQAQAILVEVAVALVENLAVRQVRILVDGAVDRAAQADEKPVEALRHAKGGAGGGDERALGHGGVEVGAARPLRVELEAPFDIDLRIAADVEAQAELALAFRPVCALDVRVLAVAAAHRAGERMRRPVALQPDLAVGPKHGRALVEASGAVGVGIVADALLDRRQAR